ncbi:hypothetical protein SEA_HANNACONDA_88 [Mycobacterium phage Hannaconda]|nr:hypothetical protein SEA_HANNACONDA_88 [Mycobacterium phage Hannaconda]
MTDSTMLREAAIKKLMDIQEVCNREVESGWVLQSVFLAEAILDIIKGE